MFVKELGKIFNSGAARSVIVYGNIYDLFEHEGLWRPLVPHIQERFKLSSWIQVVYKLNGPIILGNHNKIRDAWTEWKTGLDANDLAIQEMLGRRGESEKQRVEENFDSILHDAIGKPALAFEFLRQLTMASRTRALKENLFIIIEGADMAMPSAELSRLSDAQYRRIAITQDWFCDPQFTQGRDCVCLIAESPSIVHRRISSLPQVLSVEVPSPDKETREVYIKTFMEQHPNKISEFNETDLAALTAGLSIQALGQLLTQGAYNRKLSISDIVSKVELFIKSQVGDDVIEFSKPEHRLDDVIGNKSLKAFLKKEVIPRFKKEGKKALSGAAVGGSIGSGKTFIFEALAAELGLPVLVLKNLRSQWFGQTDVVFERLRRTLEALGKVLIFVDEADTQFGSVSQESHSTERRLTGKIQQMMSDPKLRGKVMWLLMTARIHLLSPDIRRPGRVGDLIIPVLDPQGEDRAAFVTWMLATPFASSKWAKAVLRARMKSAEEAGLITTEGEPGFLSKSDEEAQNMIAEINKFKKEIDALLPENASAAMFASLKSYIESMELTVEEVPAAIEDHIPPEIGDSRRYQELQALINCTRKSLLKGHASVDKGGPVKEVRKLWRKEIKKLEKEGIS